MGLTLRGTNTMLTLFALAAVVVVGQAQTLPPPVTGADFNDTMCGACLMTMSNLDTVLDTKETADQVRVFADSICGHLPEGASGQGWGEKCKATAKSEIMRITKCMVQKANLPSYCYSAGVPGCKAPRSSKSVNQAGVCSWWNTKEDVLNGKGCNYIVNGMKMQLNTTEYRSKVISMLRTNFCPQLAFAKEKCDVVLQQYGGAILNQVMANFDADIFCCDIGYSVGQQVPEEDYQKFQTWISSVEQPWSAHVADLNGMFGWASSAGAAAGSAE